MKLKYAMLVCAVLLLSAFTAKKPITVFMIGDSTMANKPIEGGNQERGWGHVLQGFFTEDIIVDNHARNGRSSKSFIDEGLWQDVIDKVTPGDYVFIQFGHNDEKPKADRHTDPGSTFDDNLRKFVNETRAKGGIPVLFNSIVRRNFGNNPNAVAEDDIRADIDKVVRPDEGKVLIDTHGKYLDSPRDVAKELNVPFVDMNKITHELVQGMGPEESKKLFMWIPKGLYAASPNGREDNTHLNIYGARTIAGLTIDEIAKTVPALAPYVRHYDIVVAKDGSGDFLTVQEAIDAVPDFRKNNRTTILVRKGIYKEKIVIPESKINVSMIGETGTVITNDDYASKKNKFGEEMSTSGSSTFYVYAPDFMAENITFENSAGRVGQAVACFVSADRAIFRNCRFIGNQDTLYTYGKNCRQLYDNCYIEGTVDFIFGSSTALFTNCTIKSLSDGYVTAPSTLQGKPYGYVFIDCNLVASPEAGKVYLSRPWRPYAQAVFVNCNMEKHIIPEGWNNWGKKESEKTVFYAEYKSKGEGGDMSKRASFGKKLKDASSFTPEKVLAGEDGWNPFQRK